TGEASLVVVEPRDRTGQSMIRFVRGIRDQFPNVPVVAYCNLSPPFASNDILALARAGVNDLIIRDIDDERIALREAVDVAQSHCLAEQALEVLAPFFPPTVRPFLTYCLEHATRQLS